MLRKQRQVVFIRLNSRFDICLYTIQILSFYYTFFNRFVWEITATLTHVNIHKSVSLVFKTVSLVLSKLLLWHGVHRFRDQSTAFKIKYIRFSFPDVYKKKISRQTVYPILYKKKILSSKTNEIRCT